MAELMDIDPAELRGFAEQVRRAATHAVDLRAYATGPCRDTTGLTGVLGVFGEPLALLSAATATILERADGGLGQTSADIALAAGDAECSDADSARRIGGLFPVAPDFFPEYAGPGGSWYGYQDIGSPGPGVPEDSLEARSAADLDPGGVLASVDETWRQATGEGLLAAVVEPLVGDPGRLAWLSDAYAELGDACYLVAWNLRSGTFNVVPHWNGDSGRAFELHMFRWHLGLGGLGDAQQLVSGALDRAYEFVSPAVHAAARRVTRLAHRITGLTQAPSTEDDYGALEEIWDDVWTIKDDIATIGKACAGHRARIEAVLATVEPVLAASRDVTAALRDAAARSPYPTFNIEGDDGWDAAAGAARVALLPI